MTDLKTIAVPMFADVSIADGAVHLMDGGIHGVQGHEIVVPASLDDAPWKRRIDSLRPSGKANAGTLGLDTHDRASFQQWADSLWQLAPRGKASFDGPLAGGPSRWVWAIVLRRGAEVRVLSGGSMTPTNGAPAPAQAALAWMIAKVDAASAGDSGR